MRSLQKMSYFFGQGYKDIGDAIRLSWRKNASTAKNIMTLLLRRA